jgi:hypothetical protein
VRFTSVEERVENLTDGRFPAGCSGKAFHEAIHLTTHAMRGAARRRRVLGLDRRHVVHARPCCLLRISTGWQPPPADSRLDAAPALLM